MPKNHFFKFQIIIGLVFIIGSPVPGEDTIGKKLSRIQQSQTDFYVKHIYDAELKLRTAELKIKYIVRIIQRLRVLTLKGAHGTCNYHQRRLIAIEVKQLLREMIDIANAQDKLGRYIFGGYKTKRVPFIPIYQTLSAGNQGDAAIGVDYRGNIGKIKREIAKDVYITVNIPGNEIFWATNQVLLSSTNSSKYESLVNQVIKIDGTEIHISPGGNLNMIVNKINNAKLNVKASIGNRNNLILTTTIPHQVWLEDMGSGTVLADLGLVDPKFLSPANNINPAVSIRGVSIFEMAIQIRDDLARNDSARLGIQDLGILESALDNVLMHYSLIKAKRNKIKYLKK
ncbi:MAG: hypothetical protein GY754_01680 [bacterium]|nr:hypothetical protein [bacterium]